jgi:hypothetical protein
MQKQMDKNSRRYKHRRQLSPLFRRIEKALLVPIASNKICANASRSFVDNIFWLQTPARSRRRTR